jgi:hypothetical protein
MTRRAPPNRSRRRAASRGRDPAQANLLGAIALGFGVCGIILPLPLGLAGILLAGWAVWRHGRTATAIAGLAGATVLTIAGIALGASL